jgi:hypothetical protein
MVVCLIIISSQDEYALFIRNSFIQLRKCEIDIRVGLREGIFCPDLKDSEVNFLGDFSDLAEMNRALMYPTIKNFNKVLVIDPDEFYSIKLLQDIKEWARNASSNAIGEVPFRYYFKDQVLIGTPWGGLRSFPKVLSPNHLLESQFVHGRASGEISQIETSDYVMHFWAKDIATIRHKHNSYLEWEPASMFHASLSASPYKILFRISRGIFGALKTIKIGDGTSGVLLTLEFVRYLCLREIAYFRRFGTFI